MKRITFCIILIISTIIVVSCETSGNNQISQFNNTRANRTTQQDNDLHEKYKIIERYREFVLNPTMNSIRNSVRLENEQYILLFMPELIYRLTDKETGITTEGRSGFRMNITMTEGKLFLLETDNTRMTMEQFLSSQYTENAQTVIIPIACSKNEVSYVYEKPLELKGTIITFGITEIRSR